MFKVLIAEDDKNLRMLIESTLKRTGYQTFSCENGERAMELMDCQHIDLMVCDIMMPGMGGYELTSELRQSGYELPILFVTAKGTFDDKRAGFESGGDDYMVKPVDMNELLLRVAALLRRSRIVSEHMLRVGDATLDYNKLTVARTGECVELPKKEFYLLYKLLSYPQQIFTRQQLMDEIWGMDAQSDERTVDVHIKRLREKFESFDEFDIVTVRGLGYKAVRNV